MATKVQCVFVAMASQHVDGLVNGFLEDSAVHHWSAP